MSDLAPGRSVWRDVADVWWLLVVGVATLTTAVVIGLKTAGGQDLDQSILRSFRVDRFTSGPIERLLHTIGFGPILLVTVACALVALAQWQWRLAIAIPIFVLGANQTTQLLKRDFLTRGDGGPMLPVSMPSGHATVALTLAVAGVLATPRIIRPLASLVGGLVAGFAALGTMAERWHRPGDVIASVGVVLVWGSLAIVLGGAWLHEPRVRPAGFDRGVGHSALAVLGVGGAAYLLHRMGMGPMPGSRAETLVYSSLVVVGLVVGIGVGLCAVVADRRIHHPPPSLTPGVEEMS